ncbi:Mu transposase C-terminal domain-containing protein [Paenibacillus sp. ACRRX]|uniref:Mu transposase C-terminal domain-containing protein n=1 Tax=Paenibacillus sp. ACRRX TaxID=2918206 RepID=UPI001EF3FA7A|nr:Mu transposase C-terminal domain-containing protein [Paenibacillus sp. ACRRX]
MIYFNHVYQYINIEKNNRFRIVELNSPYAYIVDLDSDTSMPKQVEISVLDTEIMAETLLPIPDPYARNYDDRNLSSTIVMKRDSEWDIVSYGWNTYRSELLTKQKREAIIEQLAVQHNTNKLKIKRIFTRFWQRGLVKNALLPDYIYSGGKGKTRVLTDVKVGRPRKYGSQDGNQGINITEEVKLQFFHVIKKYYRQKEKQSLADTYDLLLRDFYSDVYYENGVKKFKVWDRTRIPTYHQFYYWYNKNKDDKADILFRESTKYFESNKRPLLSNSLSEVDGPGARYQVDATIADIYLVSSFDRSLIIGRPVVYGVIDVYSRMVTGIYVGLEGPSWVGAMMALDNMITDKVEYCSKYEIPINETQWPAKHLPDIILADRGEFEGYAVEGLINNLRIKIENTSAYRGDLKGIIERHFRTMNGRIKRTSPGAIQKEFRQRGDRDYRLDATLNLKEFTKIVIHIVLEHNQTIIEKYPLEKGMITSGLTATPIHLWNWGKENKKGRLQIVTDPNVYRLNLLPKGNARITRAGIKFKGLSYSSDKAIQEQWYLKVKNKSIEIAYDPRDVSQIYILHQNGRTYDMCYLLAKNEEYKGDALEEVEFYRELLQEAKLADQAKQSEVTINTDIAISTIIRQAESEKKQDDNGLLSKASKLKGIRVNRKVEKELQRSREKFDLLPKNSIREKPAEVIKLSKRVQADEQSVPSSNNARLMEKLKKKRDEQFGKR